MFHHGVQDPFTRIFSMEVPTQDSIFLGCPTPVLGESSQQAPVVPPSRSDSAESDLGGADCSGGSIEDGELQEEGISESSSDLEPVRSSSDGRGELEPEIFHDCAHIPLYLYPFLNTTSKTSPFEYLRLTSWGVIGALMKVDDSEVIGFLLRTVIIPLCLCTMKMGGELSKTITRYSFFDGHSDDAPPWRNSGLQETICRQENCRGRGYYASGCPSLDKMAKKPGDRQHAQKLWHCWAQEQ